jgi:hypothetical protein
MNLGIELTSKDHGSDCESLTFTTRPGSVPFTLKVYNPFSLVKLHKVQLDPVIRGLFICEFAYSHFKKWFKMPNSQSKCVLLSANSVFVVQNSGMYLPRYRYFCRNRNRTEKRLLNFQPKPEPKTDLNWNRNRNRNQKQ